jgi:secreted trypsin-like serine protease
MLGAPPWRAPCDVSAQEELTMTIRSLARSLSPFSVLGLAAAAALTAFALSGCAVEADDEVLSQSADPIVGGKVTTARPSVGLLLDVTDQAKGSVGICTGTVVGKRTVLTAAHCLDRAGQKSTFTVHDSSGKGTTANVVSRAQAPGYKKLPATGVTREQFYANPDIAIVRLDRELPVRAIPIATDAPVVGTFITIVGYGATAAGARDAGKAKRQTTNFIKAVEDDHISFNQVAGVFGLSCGGDSGGPALVKAGTGEAVAAVTHFGDCGTLSAYTRADVFKAFIERASGGDVVFADETGLPNARR